MSIYNHITIIIITLVIILNYLNIVNVNSRMMLLIIIIDRIFKKININEMFTQISADDYKEVIPDDIVPEIGCTKEFPYLSSHDGATYCYNNKKCTNADERINDYCGPSTRVNGPDPPPPDEGCSKKFPYRTKHPDDSSNEYKYCYNNIKCTTEEGRPEEDCGSNTRAEPPNVFAASEQYIKWHNMSKTDQEAYRKACADQENTVFNMGKCIKLTPKEICEKEGGTFVSGLKTGGLDICEKPETIEDEPIECCECVNPMNEKKMFRLFGQILNGDSATIPEYYAKPLSITKRLRVNGDIYVKGQVRMVTRNNKLNINGSIINGNNKKVLQIGASGGSNLNVNNCNLFGDNTNPGFKNETFANTKNIKSEKKETFLDFFPLNMATMLANIQDGMAKAAERQRKAEEERRKKLNRAKVIKNVSNPGFEIRNYGQVNGRVAVLQPTLSHKLFKSDLNAGNYGRLTVKGKIHAGGNFEADILHHSGRAGQCYIFAKNANTFMDCGYNGQWQHPAKGGLWFSHISAR